MKETRADFGIALDGDADRVVMCDERGHIIDGDQILALIARSWSKTGRAQGRRRRRHGDVEHRPGALSSGLNLKLVRSPVGDRYVIEKMREGGFNVGGEQSGHIIFSDFITTGDGLIAALQVLAVLAEERRPASEAVHMFEPAPQVLENVRFTNGSPLTDPKVASAIKLVRAEASMAAACSCASRAPSPSSASWARARTRSWCARWSRKSPQLHP